MDSKTVGIIGAGRLGQAMALTALRAGREVAMANSRGPESLTSVVSALGDGASAGRWPRPPEPASLSSLCPGPASGRPSGTAVERAACDRHDERLRSQ